MNKEILEEIYDIQVRYTKPLLKRNYIDKDYTIERYENLVFKMKNYINNLQEYKQRNEKAIEYMKKIANTNDAGNYEQFKDYIEYNNLLNILKGDEDE